MKFSYESLSTLIKTIREVEKLEASLLYVEYYNAIKKQLMANEYYYSQKIQHSELKKVDFLSDVHVGNYSNYQDFVLETQEKIQHREFNNNFLLDLQRSLNFQQFELDPKFFEQQIKVDKIINAAELFRMIYIGFPKKDKNFEFASTMTNAFLYKNGISNFNCFIAEIVHSNPSFFYAGVVDEEKWPCVYCQLIHGQFKKNNQRITNTINLFNNDRELISVFGNGIFSYITKNVIFTVTDFTEKNSISYNTAKKYLQSLVDQGILDKMKLGRHNAFVYTKLYDVWIK